MKTKPIITVTENGNLHIHIPMVLRRMQGRKRIIAPESLDGNIPDAITPVQSPLVQALTRAFAWSEILESGQVQSITELAERLDFDGSYITRIIKLTTLAPDIIEAILNGEEPSGLSLTKLTKLFPKEWNQQRVEFGFLSA